MMKKIERKYLAHYIDASFGGTTNYVRIGKDLEEYAEELNPDVEISKNILGEQTIIHKGYEVQSEVDPFYACSGDPLFEHLAQIANERLTGDDCKTTKVDVLLNEDGSVEWAYRENVYVVPSSIGGSTSGVQIPFVIYNAGNRTSGDFNTATNTFSEPTDEPPSVYIIDDVSEGGLQYSTPQISYDEGYLVFESQELSIISIYANAALKLEQLSDSKKSDSTTLFETLIADSHSSEISDNAIIISDNGDGTVQYLFPPDLITGNIYMFVEYV